MAYVIAILPPLIEIPNDTPDLRVTVSTHIDRHPRLERHGAYTKDILTTFCSRNLFFQTKLTIVCSLCMYCVRSMYMRRCRISMKTVSFEFNPSVIFCPFKLVVP